MHCILRPIYPFLSAAGWKARLSPMSVYLSKCSLMIARLRNQEYMCRYLFSNYYLGWIWPSLCEGNGFFRFHLTNLCQETWGALGRWVRRLMYFLGGTVLPGPCSWGAHAGSLRYEAHVIRKRALPILILPICFAFSPPSEKYIQQKLQ